MGTSVDYSGVAHETIHQRITGGPGSTDLVGASRGWESVAAKLRDLHGQLEQAIRGIGAAQQGAAADAATNATMALMPWLENNARMADAMAARISHQADSFGHTRDNMPPPVKVPEVSFSQDPLTWMGQHAVEWMPGIQTEHEGAEVAAQQAEIRAQELMTGYQSTSNFNLAIGQQQFAMAPAVVADVSNLTPGGTGGGGSSAGGNAIPGTPYSAVAPAPAAHPAPAITGHGANVAPAGTAPQIATPGSHAPAAATSPQSAGSHPVPGSQPMTGSGQFQPTAGAAAAFGPSPIVAGSGATSGHRPRGGLGVPGIPVGRGGGFGPRPSAAILGEAHSPMGSSAGQAGAEHAAAARAARGGGGGWAGVPLGAAGSSGRDDDAEHRRPGYLIEQDTNAIVGDLPAVAPPVIGQD